MAGSLYRKYRPTKFSELIGQEHVARALQNALAEDRLAHAYLFSGTRGTGKTSSARILGQVLNCRKFTDGFPSDPALIEPCGECESCIASRAGNSFDVIELDAASNNGVDDMRELIEKVSYTSAAGGTKVYIIDEVHELTGRASNALLKTLEEPPEHVVFILATTNPEKVLPTIRSRTQHFEFVSLPEDKLLAHAKNVLEWENKTLDEESLDHVVRKGAGSVRDMLSYLDQVLALDISSYEELQKTQSTTDTTVALQVISQAAAGDIAATMSALHELSSAGKEPRAIVETIISVARDCLIVSLNPETSTLLSSHTDKAQLKEVGDRAGKNFLVGFLLKLGKAVSDIRGTASLNPLLTVEIAILSTMNAGGGPDTAFTPGSVSRSAPADRSNRSLQSATAPSSTPAASSSPANAEAKASDPVASAGDAWKPVPDARSVRKEAPERRMAETVEMPAQAKAASEETSSTGGAKKATLGALKKGSFAPVQADAPEEKKAPAKKLTLRDVAASWPKVVQLLSPASQEEIKKVIPTDLQGDVLTFGAPAEQIDNIKARFKKDAAIIRGFLESLHETTFRFQIVVANQVDIAKAEQAEAREQQKEIAEETKLAEDSEEYDVVNHAVEMFGGEVVPEN